MTQNLRNVQAGQKIWFQLLKSFELKLNSATVSSGNRSVSKHWVHKSRTVILKKMEGGGLRWGTALQAKRNCMIAVQMDGTIYSAVYMKY